MRTAIDRTPIMRTLLAALAIAFTTLALAGPGPYEGVDARAQIKSTLADAAKARLPVLIVFGANWCGDCKMLDTAFKEGASAPLIAKSFKVVKVDVGRSHRGTRSVEFLLHRNDATHQRGRDLLR
jgi:protein disulfide-isomerase